MSKRMHQTMNHDPQIENIWAHGEEKDKNMDAMGYLVVLHMLGDPCWRGELE